MASAVPTNASKINQPNFCKYVLLIMEPCSEAFFYVYKWLYSWHPAKPEDLKDYLDKIPIYDKNQWKKAKESPESQSK